MRNVNIYISRKLSKAEIKKISKKVELAIEQQIKEAQLREYKRRLLKSIAYNNLNGEIPEDSIKVLLKQIN